MKKADFLALPEGTVVLLRPTGPGSRGHEARHELILARLDGTDRYGRAPRYTVLDQAGSPAGFRADPDGDARALTVLSRLYRHSPDDGDEHWVPTLSGTPEAEVARNVVGVWEDVKDSVLAKRREHFAEKARAKEARSAKEAAERESHEAALATVRPVMRAAGISEEAHAATRSRARLKDRTFTTEEVARIVNTLSKEGGS